jgi:hypothetical protein
MQLTPGEIIVKTVADAPNWVFGDVFKLALIVAGIFILWTSLKFNQWSRRQIAVDELALLLSDAIHDLLNRRVTNIQELSQLKSDISDWQKNVSEKINSYPAYFSKADQLHFDRLGTIIQMQWENAFRVKPDDKRHDHELNMLSLKFDRLRDIINWAQQRTR